MVKSNIQDQKPWKVSISYSKPKKYKPSPIYVGLKVYNISKLFQTTAIKLAIFSPEMKNILTEKAYYILGRILKWFLASRTEFGFYFSNYRENVLSVCYNKLYMHGFVSFTTVWNNLDRAQFTCFCIYYFCNNSNRCYCTEIFHCPRYSSRIFFLSQKKNHLHNAIGWAVTYYCNFFIQPQMRILLVFKYIRDLPLWLSLQRLVSYILNGSLEPACETALTVSR